MLVSKSIEKDILTTDDFDSEPVHYCKKCLSLRVMALEGNDYCDTCSSTDIETTDIMSWAEMYKERYGKEFLNSK